MFLNSKESEVKCLFPFLEIFAFYFYKLISSAKAPKFVRFQFWSRRKFQTLSASPLMWPAADKKYYLVVTNADERTHPDEKNTIGSRVGFIFISNTTLGK